MKRIILFALIPLSLISASANAGVGDVKGKSICTKIYSVDKSQYKNIPCTYEGRLGGSASYNILELSFKLSNGDKYNTVDNIWFKSDNNGNYLWKESYVYINDEVADIVYLLPKTFKEIPKSRLHRPENSKALYCVKKVDSNGAFCIPYSLRLYLD